MKYSIRFGGLSVVLFALALLALPAVASATTITTSYSGPASGLDPVSIPGGNWGSTNLSLNAPAISITSGTLAGAAGLNGTGLNINSGTVTIDGPTTLLQDASTKNYPTGAFKMAGTSQLVIQNGGTFLEGGFTRFYNTSILHVTGAGSVAQLDYSDGDGVENMGNARIQVDNGGVLYAGTKNFTGNNNSGFAGMWQGSSPTNYAITVDGPNSVVSTKGFQWMGGVSNGILHATNGGALEMLASSQWDYSGVTTKSDLTHINIDGGGLSYKDCGATVNMNGNQTVTANPDPSDFTFTGSNFFRLNNSTATDTGSYTLANNLGPKNYTRLELVNGITSVTRAITVDGDNGGEILLNDTVASIANGVTLTGAAAATITANGTSSSLAGIIGGSGSLNKKGPGTLVLSGPNTYGGDTLVDQGVLSIDFPYLADGKDVRLDNSGLSLGGTLDLNTGSVTVDTINSLYIGGVQQAAGVWGAIGSSAPNQSSFITGTGELNVVMGVPEPSTFALLGVGLLSMLAYGWRRRRAPAA